MKSRFIYIIFAIMLLLLLEPFLETLGLSGHLFSTVITALIPLSSAFALTQKRQNSIIILFIAAPFVILHGLNFFFTSQLLTIVAFSCATFLYFYIVYLLVENLLAIKAVTADLLFCAISTYLLIGVGWSGIYAVIESISPGSFVGGSEPVDLTYFSFVSLTTLGYGDVLPLSAIAKRLVILEAIMGSIYMAVIVAIIVGRYMSMQTTQDAKGEIS